MICRGTSQFWIAVSESLLVTGCHPVDRQSCLPAFAKYRYIRCPYLSASICISHQDPPRTVCWSQLMVVWSRWWYKFHSSYIFWPTRRCRESYIRYILDIHNPSYSHFLHQLLDFHWLSASTSCGCGVHILWQILWSGTVRSRLACFTSGFGSSFGSGSGCEFQPPMAQRTQRYPKVDLKRFTNRWCVCANGLLQTELNWGSALFPHCMMEEALLSGIFKYYIILLYELWGVFNWPMPTCMCVCVHVYCKYATCD